MQALASRSRSAAAAAMLALIGLAGCADVPDVPPHTLVGGPLGALTLDLPAETGLILQDVSGLYGIEPTRVDHYDGSAWIIVAACADAASVFSATTVEVAIVPVRGAPSDLDERIDDGEFDDAVSCDDGRTFR